MWVYIVEKNYQCKEYYMRNILQGTELTFILDNVAAHSGQIMGFMYKYKQRYNVRFALFMLETINSVTLASHNTLSFVLILFPFLDLLLTSRTNAKSTECSSIEVRACVRACLPAECKQTQ